MHEVHEFLIKINLFNCFVTFVCTTSARHCGQNMHYETTNNGDKEMLLRGEKGA